MPPPSNPCQRCGACCAAFRVDFDGSELTGGAYAWEGGVPPGLAAPLIGRLYRMHGSDAEPPRCIALVGAIGQAVACRIYAARPSPCREFEAGQPACARARRRHGLPPLDATEL